MFGPFCGNPNFGSAATGAPATNRGRAAKRQNARAKIKTSARGGRGLQKPRRRKSDTGARGIRARRDRMSRIRFRNRLFSCPNRCRRRSTRGRSTIPEARSRKAKTARRTLRKAIKFSSGIFSWKIWFKKSAVFFNTQISAVSLSRRTAALPAGRKPCPIRSTGRRFPI